jgi:hypothetical protein
VVRWLKAVTICWFVSAECIIAVLLTFSPRRHAGGRGRHDERIGRGEGDGKRSGIAPEVKEGRWYVLRYLFSFTMIARKLLAFRSAFRPGEVQERRKQYI